MADVPRLDVLLARNLGVSKTTARRLLASGQARPLDPDVVGTASDPRFSVGTDRLPLRMRVGDDEVALHDRLDLVLHKPVGCVTALRDARHPVAYALLRGAPLYPELRPAGRLDLDTSGLLLWSTDGAWIQRLTHPKRAVPRTYQAALARPYRPWSEGLVLEDGHVPRVTELSPLEPGELHPALLRPTEATCFATITLTGGAYHEVRRVFAALGSHVLGLCRVGMGGYRLPEDLPVGTYRLIQAKDVAV